MLCFSGLSREKDFNLCIFTAAVLCSSSSNGVVVGWDEASAALKSGKRAALRIFEKSRLWIAKNFSINFAYTYGSFVYHKVCEEDRGSLNTLCKTLFWQASHCLLLPSSLLKEIVVTVCVILSNFPRSFGPTLIHKNKQCWHHLFLPLFLSPIQKYPRNAFFMTKQEKPSFQLLVPLLLWSLHFEELK